MTNLGLCPHRPKQHNKINVMINTLTEKEIKYGIRNSKMFLNEIH